jgi:hypothetical protein
MKQNNLNRFTFQTLAVVFITFASLTSRAQVSAGWWGPTWIGTNVPTVTGDWAWFGNPNPPAQATCGGCPPPVPYPTLTLESWVGDIDVKNRVSLTIVNDVETGRNGSLQHIMEVYRRTNGGQFEPKFIIDGEGNTFIGVDPIAHPPVAGVTDGFNLYVSEGIITERVKVATLGSAEWPDYVFSDNYDLMNLNQLEAFINHNKHLPNVPSAQEVEKDGLDLAEMDAKLLRKIEELTLYVIDLKKENDELRVAVEKLSK